MTTSRQPFVVGLGGTLRANSSTERALRYCLAAVEKQGGRTRLFAAEDLDLPMYAPHELERTPRALELVKTLRDADAVVVGSPGYHGAISGLVKNALDYIEDLREDPRVYLDNTPLGMHQLRVRLAGGGRHTDPTARHRTRVARVADTARRRDQLRRADLGALRRARGYRAGQGGREPTRAVGEPGTGLRPDRQGDIVTEGHAGRR